LLFDDRQVSAPLIVGRVSAGLLQVGVYRALFVDLALINPVPQRKRNLFNSNGFSNPFPIALNRCVGAKKS
jgi:hypothetical protein